jgi:predicted amidohydrolase
VVDPWGEVLLDMGGEAAGLAFAEIDPPASPRCARNCPALPTAAHSILPA